MKVACSIEAFGERGWLARLEGFADDVAGGLFANAVADRLRAGEGVTDAVAGVDSVALKFDPVRMNAEDARGLLEESVKKTPKKRRPPAAKMIDIPVCYGGACGPDFDALCERFNLSADALIELHAKPRYRVVTLGFAPGFAYLGGLDKRLEVPRLETPRAQVEAGSIGIAGAMTGIYSLPSPGGWRLVGRTPMTLFERGGASPFLLEPGAEIRFHPISESEFKKRRKETT